jgi:Cft2 family RNA processing exonuclease
MLLTRETLALAGRTADRQARTALVTAFGRPFFLGDLRIELHSSGLLPGAACLSCRVAGRAVTYAGLLGRGAEVRTADAVCVDARWATLGVRPSQAVVEETLEDLVAGLRRDARSAVFLVDPLTGTHALGPRLLAAGLGLRGHRRHVQAAGRLAPTGQAGAPVRRFDGRLAAGEVLLWPVEAAHAGRVRALREALVVLVGPEAVNAEARAAAGAQIGLPLATDADPEDILDYLAASGASEVAVTHDRDGAFTARLLARGLDAYRVGPPAQLELPARGGGVPAST